MKCTPKGWAALGFCAAAACLLSLLLALALRQEPDFTLIAELGEADACYSAQGMAVSDRYAYVAQRGGGDARAVIHRVEIPTGERVLMTDSATRLTVFTGLGHANDLDHAEIAGVEYLYVLAEARILVFEILGTELKAQAAYDLTYNGRPFFPTGFAVRAADDSHISFLFKWATTVSSGAIRKEATSGSIGVSVMGYLDESQLAEPDDWTRQAMDCIGNMLYVALSGNGTDTDANRSVILGYDLSEFTGSNHVSPAPEQIFHLIGEEYPALFEVEDVALDPSGRMYFNTNGRISSSDTAHDGVFVMNRSPLHGTARTKP